MENRIVSPMPLEEGLKLHPNVAYVPPKRKFNLPAVIPESTFRSVHLDKIRNLLRYPLSETQKGLYRRLPSLWNISVGFDGMVERTALEHRLEKFKTKDPTRFDAHFRKVQQKFKDLDNQALELQELLKDFKEAVNIHYERTSKGVK